MSNIHAGKVLPAGWFVYTTEDGRPYFHNRVTSSTQWDPPAETIDFSNATLSNDNANIFLENNSEARDTSLSLYPKGSSLRTDSVFQLTEDAFLPDNKNAFPSLEGEITGILNPSNTASPGPRTMDLEFGRGNSNLASNKSDRHPLLWLFNIDALMPYFDVDTSTVVTRLKKTLSFHHIIKTHYFQNVSTSPRSSSSTSFPCLFEFEELKASPDFYGPFWIPTTVTIFIFMCSYINHFLVNPNVSGANYRHLVSSSVLVYLYLFCVPLLVWSLSFIMLDSTLKPNITLAQLFSLYGYSFAYALPATVLSIIPYTPCRWVTVLLGTLLSSSFLVFPLRSDLQNVPAQFKLGILAVFFLSQASFYIAMSMFYS